jgi:cytochrome c-type biogenesis protein CcmF
VLVIYSTFLTRSGILGDSSVHSFTDPGTIVYGLLIIFLAGSILLGFGFFALRYKEMKAIAKPMHWLTREFALSLGSFLLMGSAAIVFFGTSMPLVSSSQVDPSFYNKMHLPIGIVMSLLIGYSLLVRWEQEDGMFLKEKSWKSISGALIGTVVIGFFSMWDFFYLLFIFGALFALFVNLELTIMTIRGDIRMLGGKITHMGLAVFLIGVIVSGFFDQKKNSDARTRKTAGRSRIYRHLHREGCCGREQDSILRDRRETGTVRCAGADDVRNGEFGDDAESRHRVVPDT